MSFPTRTVDFFESFVDDAGETKVIYEGKLVVRRADVGVGMERVVQREEFQTEFFAKHDIKNLKVLSLAENRRLAADYIMGINTYVACVSATISVENNELAEKQLTADITFDDFKTLPEQIAVAWEKAVFELNPHWGLKQDDDSQGEAKRNRGKKKRKKKSSTGSAQTT